MTGEPVWRWTKGHTIRGLDGRYIARIWRAGKRGYDMPPAARYLDGSRLHGVWEIEGYGDTPDAAIADLRSKFRGRIAEPEPES